EDPARRITGLSDVVSAGSDETGNSVLTSTDLGYYMNNGTGGASRVEVYSPGPVNSPVAVSLRPGTYDQVFIDENGNVQWWTYDDAAGGMARVPSLEVSGLDLNWGYAHPREYYSVVLKTVPPCDAACLTVAEDKPAGTLISYYISSDGGSSFTPITPGGWTAVSKGSNFVLKATLDTADTQQTPRILQVTLEVDEDFIITGNISPYPAERGRNVTISARAVRLTTGAPVMLDSCAVRYPLETKKNGEPALAGGQLPIDAPMIYNAVSGFWEYTFTVPEKTVAGRWPDDGVYLVCITGLLETAQKQITLDLEVNGNILGRLIIRTVSW
ncbi:MAG: hypothetical protein K6T65_12635, partial [Peptococcaceae bacterium]|nr:hypothetical protein [Peptococcaceae bacterium]